MLTYNGYGRIRKEVEDLLYKDEMLSVCLSVGTFWHARSFAVSPRIRAKFARNEAPVLKEHGVRFKMVLIHVVRRLQRFECQGVDDFLPKLHLHSCKTAAQTH